jgi:hypothetical protein
MEQRKSTWPIKFSITEPARENSHTGCHAPLTANPWISNRQLETIRNSRNLFRITQINFSNRPKKMPFAHVFLIDPGDD